ncbi:MAG TPA: hypothetical protein GX498_00800 [Clostridiales bacterium]|nr:hypothetical protein [Clostridiales bacterium]
MFRKIINNSSGSRFTFISIILIIVMSLFVRVIVPSNAPSNSDSVPSERIVYLDNQYVYKETLSASPIKFVRGMEGSKEGFRVLLMRKDRKKSVPEEIYIYIGNKRYMKYVLDIDTK